MRRDILARDAAIKFLEPLEAHGWAASIEKCFDDDEYLLVRAKRGSREHLFALLYTSAVCNALYKRLASDVEHIFVNGELYNVEAYAYGIDKPVSSAADFRAILNVWNSEGADGKFVGDEDDVVSPRRAEQRRILSETPVEAIWLRLQQLQSVTLAKRMLRERYSHESVDIPEVTLHQKAEGIAYALRNATDYFRESAAHRNVSQRILNLYYGSIAFAFAEMLSQPDGAETLADLEQHTKHGHGLYTLDGTEAGLEHLVIGVIRSGFFTSWMETAGLDVTWIPSKKPKRYEDLSNVPAASWTTIERLFATIPELSDLFIDIFEAAPRYVTPTYNMAANGSPVNPRPGDSATSYVDLIDYSARLSKEEIAGFKGPIDQIHGGVVRDSYKSFRVAVTHATKYWHQALKIHRSPLAPATILLPIFQTVDDFRMICVVLLYGLSIVVRYRPSIWRRVQEGDLDHIRILIEAFLAVVERVLPEEFLGKITAQTISAVQPGSIYA